jgi:hypothetical protein
VIAILIILAVIALLLAITLVAWFRDLRRPPYAMEDFGQTCKRIQEGIAGLAGRLEGGPRPDLPGLPELPDRPFPPESLSLLGDMRQATGFMLTLASESSGDALRRTPPAQHPPIWKSLRETHAAGTSLQWRLRLARWQFALAPARDSGDRSLLDAGRQFVVLCAAFGELLVQCGPKTRQVSGHDLSV